jgi:hypothetical protein
VAIAKREAKLWHNTIRVGCACFHRHGHLENHEVDSADFEDFLSDRYGDEYQVEINGQLEPDYPNKEDLKKAMDRIKAYARKGSEKEPRIRIKDFEGELWIDRGSPDWSAVRVNAEGWRIEPIMRAPLIRGGGMRPLPIPIRGGDIQEHREFINLNDFALFCGNMASMLNPSGSYPTTLICGPPGSAKTTITKAMRALTDPHEIDTRFVSGVRDLMHGASQTHIIGLENNSSLSQQLSNAICALNTGTSYAERQFYEQGREYISKLRCPVIINGIPANIVDQSDLIDRTITFKCDYLGDRVRSDTMLWRRFDEAKPTIFGALLDGLVGAMKTLAQFGGDIDKAADALLGGWRPRFVDAVVWAEAACRAMGFAPGEYAEAHKNNKYVAYREIADRVPLCIGIKKLMAKRDEWQGYPEQLSAAISPYVTVNGVWIGRTLAWFIGVLDKVCGINVEMNKELCRGDNQNGIIIRVSKVSKVSKISTSTEPPDGEKPSGGGNFLRKI